MTRRDPYGHRAVWAIAAPLILSNVTVPMLGVVDTAVMGHLDSPLYLGAVAVGATIFSFLYTGLNFLRMGTTGITAQALGRDDNDELRTILMQVTGIAFALALVLVAVQGPVGTAALALIDPAGDVAGEARRYFDIRIWSAPAALGNFALVGWFIGMHNARAPLIMMAVTNLINITLDVAFVVYLGMQADGVALASVIAEYSGVALGLALVAGVLRGRPGRWRRDHVFDAERVKRLFMVNSNLLVRTLSLMFSFAFLTAMSARQGTLILAANAILLNLQYVMAYALDGLANAAEALVGRAVGSKDRHNLKRSIHIPMLWSGATAAAMSLGYLAGGWLLIRLLTDLDDVRAAAMTFLPWLILSPVVSVWSFLYDGVYVGATLAREMRNTMLFSTFAVFLPAYYLLQPQLGNHGLWLAFLLFMAARGLTMHWLLPRRLPGYAATT